jgi:hypothetical protein
MYDFWRVLPQRIIKSSPPSPPHLPQISIFGEAGLEGSWRWRGKTSPFELWPPAWSAYIRGDSPQNNNSAEIFDKIFKGLADKWVLASSMYY